MTHPCVYTYSQLSAESAGRLIASHYDTIEPQCCKFYMLGLHDNYLIESDAGAYILRIYRNDWRSHEEVYFELELLLYLDGKHAPVATPVLTTLGEPAFSIDSPEGNRLAVLFNYADGYAPEDNLTTEHCRCLGRAVATVHELSDTFSTKQRRPELDIDHLIDESIETIKPFLEPDGVACIDAFHISLRDKWPSLPKEIGMFGICLGDVNSKNFHIGRNQNVTLFDFDQCGFGYRAFEIGKFSSSLIKHNQKNTLVNAFLEGYQEVRQLKEIECEAIEYFELVAVVWVMAIHARNANRIGHKYLEQRYWNEKLQVLIKLEAQQGAAPDADKRRR